ncbi:hypothetical protein TW86_04020 [Halomonas sp. S2151]|uniref:hypothetical protein n=1 Tax=Halomonas sp. S2151 TaxID=579478 RepID=UPI0005FA5564|nr:hypothetical protein [Halomonas sp. S2151]KJZ17427.1 hypothetical protein TW86_04020 [Halomonas sp. S2151]
MKVGFYGPYPIQAQQVHLYIEESRIYVGILAPFTSKHYKPEHFMTYPEYLEWFKTVEAEHEYAGYPNNNYNHYIVTGVPGHDPEARFLILGKLGFDLRYAAGEDEVTDFTILDVNIYNDRTLAGIQNRFANTRNEKAIKSHRVRALDNVSTVATIVFPYKSDTFEDAELVVVPYNETGRPLGMEPDVWFDAKPPGERLIADMYSPKFVQPVVEAKAGELVRIPFSTTWNGGDEYDHAEGEPLSRAVTYKVEATAGYVPKRRIVTDEKGSGEILFRATDLEPGDEAKVKLNIGHFTGISHVTVKITE